MIPVEAKNQFEQIVTHEMFEMNRALEVVSGATFARATARGLGGSGVILVDLTQDATNSLKTRGQFILGQLLRCLAAHHVTLNAETLTEAVALLCTAIERQAQELMIKLFQRPPFHVRGLEQAKQLLETQFGQEGPRLIGRLTTELQLAAAASQISPSKSTPSLNFHGPVGLVQTGDGSQATVHQHVDNSVKNQIVTALQDLLAQLEKPENSSIGNRAEMRDLITETIAEAEKPESNTLKLGSSLRTIAETTKFVGSLGPAYGVLKPLLSFFGIHLP